METLAFIIYQFGFVIILSFFFIISILLYLKQKKESKKPPFLYASSILFAFILYEFYPLFCENPNEQVVFSGTYADNQYVSGKKELVGYGPVEDTSFKVSAIRKNNGKEVYNVIYTFNDGERWIPNQNSLSNNNVFFLGCSHVFGDGLNDNETLPHFFNEFTNYNYNVHNLAFSGYGTHQALKIVENTICTLDSVSKTSSVIYSFIPSHFERAAGKASWEIHTPHFEFENKSLVDKGSFDDNKIIKQNYLTKRLNIIWQNSFLFKSFFQPKIKKKDVTLVLEIIKKIHLLLSEKEIQFIVLIGGEHFESEYEKYFFENLIKNDIQYIFIDSILNTSNINQYLITGDGHPNKKYNEKVAKFLSKRISK